MFAGGVRVRAAWMADALHLDRLGPLLRDPWAVLRAAYLPNNLASAADAHASADRLFPLLRAGIDELGLASAVELRSLGPALPDAPSGEGDHFGSPEPAPEDAPPPAPPGDLGPYYRVTQPRLSSGSRSSSPTARWPARSSASPPPPRRPSTPVASPG